MDISDLTDYEKDVIKSFVSVASGAIQNVDEFRKELEDDMEEIEKIKPGTKEVFSYIGLALVKIASIFDEELENKEYKIVG